MKTYEHLTEEERDKLCALRNRGRTFREIGKILGRSHATLSREYRRNGRGTVYYSHRAHEKAMKRRQNHKRMRLKSRVLRTEVERMLVQGWTPEIIAGRLRREAGHAVISHEAIYQWIYEEAPHLIGYLPQSRPKRWPRRSARKTRSRIPDRVSLSERPAAALRRSEPGHWESDLIVGRGRSALQVTTDRKTRLTHIQKVPNKSAAVCRQALHEKLSLLPPSLRKTITYDNALENAEHALLNRDLGLRSFFCAPYHSWEKPTVENTNGLIRRFWPKKTNFDRITDNHVRRVQDWLNNRPRKCLSFQTPSEAQASFLGALHG